MSLDITLTDHKCEWCGRGEEVFSRNITHNLAKMADAAGIYKVVWRPDELSWVKKAGDICAALEAGIETLKSDPDGFRRYEPENKWGTYDVFVPWLEDYLRACRAYPNALIEVSR